jgi:short-subunit dehydrogenase
MIDLKDKVVVITGAANGLGKALATEFYKQGCHLALVDVNFSGLEILKNNLETPAQKITIHQADVSNEEGIITTRLDILNHHPGVDIVVNNAGISISQSFDRIDLRDYRRLFDINFWGTIYCTRYFLPDLRQQKDSRIVNIVSDFAFMGFPGKTAYGSSKSAIVGFTNALKTELADTTVKVCFVVPPPLDTGLVRNGKHMDDEKRTREAKFLGKNGLPLDETARRIVKQVRKGKYRIVVGTLMFGVDLLSRFFPTLLHRLIGVSKNRFDFI